MLAVIKDTKLAVISLLDGQVVAIPTETVYGLAADANNIPAIKQIFHIKQRPIDHPLIVHVYDLAMARQYIKSIPDYAVRLIEQFWPGPLTLVLPKSDRVSDLITAGQSTVAIRAPAHPVTRSLLQQLDRAVVAPSANKYGHISTTSPEHIQDEFSDGEFDYILDGGTTPVGIESTIIDASHADYFSILRPGSLTEQELVQVAGVPCINKQDNTIRVSGAKDSHYAPNNPVLIIESNKINNVITEQNLDNILLICYAQNKNNYLSQDLSQKNYTSASELASNLYSWLREGEKYKYIIIEQPPQTIDYLAVWDRINRASFKYRDMVKS